MAAEEVEQCLLETLADLQLDYLDLYLIHWPVGIKGSGKRLHEDLKSIKYTNFPHIEIWSALEKCVDKGLVKSIGLSNFNKRQIINILNHCRIKPAVLQIECHPYLNQKELVEFCKERNIVVTAFSPLGSPNTNRLWEKPDDPKLLTDSRLGEIAQRKGKSIAQVCIRFQIQRNIAVIPKSSNPERIKENSQVFDFELSSDEMEQIMSLNIPWRAFLPAVNVDGKEVILFQDHPEYPFSDSL